MVCLMPQSHVSCWLENPHFNMFTLNRPTCVRNRLSAFQVVQGFSAPAGRCSSALMLRCTLASRGSSRSLHSSKRAAFAVVKAAKDAGYEELYTKLDRREGQDMIDKLAKTRYRRILDQTDIVYNR